MRFLLRLLITAAALFVATRIVPGISYAGDAMGLLGVALLFGIINAFVGTMLKMLALPVVIITLGLFIFVINGFLLLLTSYASTALGFNFHVGGFFPAVVGSLVISIVSALLSIFIKSDENKGD